MPGRVEHVPAAWGERLGRDENEDWHDHFGRGGATVVSGLARRVANPLVPGGDDLAAVGEHARAADRQFAWSGCPGAVSRRGGSFLVYRGSPVRKVPVIGGEDDRPPSPGRLIEQLAQVADT